MLVVVVSVSFVTLGAGLVSFMVAFVGTEEDGRGASVKGRRMRDPWCLRGSGALVTTRSDFVLNRTGIPLFFMLLFTLQWYLFLLKTW